MLTKKATEDRIKNYENIIDGYKEDIEGLKTRPVFEDTLTGKIKALETEAQETINFILKELIDKTGKNYPQYNIVRFNDFRVPEAI